MEKIKLIMSEEQFILIMKGIHDLYSFLVGTPAKNELSQVMWNYQIKSIEKTFEVIKEYKTLNNKYFLELGFKDTKVICESVYFLKNNLGEYDEEVDCIIEFIKENNIEIVALTIPRQAAREVAKEVAEDGIKAIWNFAHTDLNMPEDVVVENVHLSESLMRLSYNIANKNGKTRNIQEG